MRGIAVATLCSLFTAGAACSPSSESIPPEAHPSMTDPTGFDAAYPPQMHELSFDSHGSKLNGLMYVAAGPGPHPTIVFLHGYAGNERNLDLAQAVRRAGVNALFFNYRGSWGSGGDFSFGNALEDAAAAVAFTRRPDASAQYRGDPDRVAVVGHSFGGFSRRSRPPKTRRSPASGFSRAPTSDPWVG